MRSLTVAIPALNEERNIESTVRAVLASARKVPGLELDILVVDDGSTDSTAEIVRALEVELSCVRLIQNPQNLGLGASLRRAIDQAKSEKMLFVPGDNDLPTVTLELLFKSTSAAEVVMCYFHNDEIRGRSRYLVSAIFTLIYTTFFDLYVQYLNGPAVYPVSKLRGLDLRSTRFSIVAEINVKLLRQGVTFVEVPSNRQAGLAGSTSFSLGNLFETFRVFSHTLLDVHVRERERYKHRPVRLSYDITLSPSAAGGNEACFDDGRERTCC